METTEQKEKTIKEKFDNLIIENLPDHIQREFKLIQIETQDFSTPKICEIFAGEFDYWYAKVQEKIPTALRDYVPVEPEESEEEKQAREEALRLAEKYAKKGGKKQ